MRWELCSKSEEITEPYKVRVDVTVDMPDGQQLSAYKEVQVVRPPVVFIHGIWSNSSSMNPMRRSIINSNLYNEYPAGHTLGVDYGAQSNQDLRKSAKFLADGVDKILQKLEKEGIKVSRVDIVAHSMGGLISRYYMLFGYMDSNGQVIGPGQAAKVRKLITLDTPHAGSHVADWYVDFMDNDYVACGTDPKKFDKNTVTDNELEWFLNTIRSKVGMQSDGLEFGEAVRQMQTPGRNGSIIDKLRSQNAANVKYYLIAGDVPLLNSWEKWFVVPIVMNSYPYCKKKLSHYEPDSRRAIYVTEPSGSCGECERQVVGNMVREFRDIIGEEDTDGVVPIKSQIDSTMLAKERWTFHSTHLGITTNPFAHYRVMEYLTDGRMAIKLHTIVISKSPGHLHIYDKLGRHVGLDPNGQPDIGINEADYVPFSDMMGEHEYIWVPETYGIRVEFLADGEGTVGLDISQGLDDGLHWFSYEDIEVKPGSKVSIQLHPTTPTGQVVHSNGATENIVPAYSEIPKGGGKNNPPTASFSIMPESPTPDDTIIGVSTSSDPDGDTLTYSWYFNGEYDENIGNLPNWTWPNPQAGEHTIKLVVDDGKGGSDEYSRKINIPGFEIALLIGAIVVALIIIKRRKHNL
jgi:pimeloyl-ACP methyl ester carboxylesterase